MAGAAVRGDVVEHDMHRQFTGNAAVDEGEELLELPARCRGVISVITHPEATSSAA